MKTSPRIRVRGFSAFCSLALALAFSPGHARGQDTFTGGAGTTGMTGADAGAFDYNTAGNWNSGLPGVNAGGHALINDGDTVDYFGGGDGGDLVIASGGELEIANGIFHQVVGGNWIQLEGNGTMLVDGGTFNQGTDSNNPFNVSGTGNLFEITAGTALFNGGLQDRSGMTYESTGGTTTITGGAINEASGATYTQSGGAVSDSNTGGTAITGAFTLSGGSLTLGGEFDYDTTGVTISGGTLTTTLITGINGPTNDDLTLSGGEIVVTGNNFSGFYAGDNPSHPVNFTLGSTGVIDFQTDTQSQVQALITAGGIQYNGIVNDTADLQVTPDQGSGYEVIVVGAVPEPSVVFGLLSGAGMLLVFGGKLRRRA